MNVFTIGFTKKTAEKFFSLLREEDINLLMDVRLNNRSQLAGFAKAADLKYFVKQLCDADYVHVEDLAPSKDILDGYKKGGMPWSEYEDRYLNLMAQRNIEQVLEPQLFDKGCLLCSEHMPHHCHRRLVVEYLKDAWDVSLDVKHLY